MNPETIMAIIISIFLTVIITAKIAMIETISGEYKRTKIQVNYKLTEYDIRSGPEKFIIDLSGSHPVLLEE